MPLHQADQFLISINSLLQQSEHRAVTRTKLLSLHEGVVEKMKEVKETFVSESADIQMYWGRYVVI